MNITHFKIFVRGLLPLLVHGVRCGLSEQARAAKDNSAGDNTDKDAKSDFLALTRGR